MTRHWGPNPFTGEQDADWHEGVIALSTRKTAPQQPEPAPVNTHPGPDLPLLQRVRDGIAALPADSNEGNEAA